MGEFTEALAGTTPGPRRPSRTMIAALVGIAALLLAAGLWRRGAPPSTAGVAQASIAVLPFADLSADHANAYLGDGIAETLINALVNVTGLTVAARTSAFSFRGRDADVREIGKQLRVASVLEGSVQRAGDQLRVTAQLIRTADGVNLWSQRFDRPATEIFAVQDEVARSAVSALQLTLAAASNVTDAPGGTHNPAAYEAYLLGRYHWNLRTTEGMIHATDALKRAVALDSSYALAWTGLADAYTLSVPDEYNVPGINPDSILTLAERAARRAIALAPRLGEAQSSLGEILEKRYRWPDALAAFQRGVQLSPTYPTAHQWYSYNLQSHNRWDDAVREMEIAHRLDPLSHVITLSLALLYDGADRFAEATPLYAQGLAQSPEAWYAWRARIGHELALGHVDMAADAYRRYLVGTGTMDSAAAARLERGLRGSGTRAATVDEISKQHDLPAAVAYTRWLRGDEPTVALVQNSTGLIPGPTGTLILYTMLGPKLRADPRIRALAPRLGAPPDTDSSNNAQRR